MADYRELLRRAVDALPENNGTSRRAVYEKAREALVTQLRAIEPPLPAREITQHRLTLEDCIRQVEQEATEALLQGLKQETEAPSAPVAPPAPEPVDEPEVVEEPIVEAAAPVEETIEPEPEPEDAPVEEDIQQDAEDIADEPDVSEETADVQDGQTVDAPAEDEAAGAADDVQSEPVEEAASAESEVEEALAEEAPADEVVSEDVDAVSEEAEETPSELGDEDKVDDEPAEEAVSVEAEAEEPTQEPEDVKAPTNPVDEVIAAAQAASSAAAIKAPKVDLDSKSTQAEKDAPTVAPALSSVREVDVDEKLPEVAISVGGDEPQATIDRAIKALDLEAEGKNGGELISGDETAKAENAAETAKSSVSALAMEEADDASVVSEEENGGNGLTVFLLLVILLLAGAGGGAYWAWKEGYVDLNPLMAQLGLSDQTTPSSETTTTPADTNTADADVPEQSNVRNVTPATTVSDLTATTPVVEEATPTPVEEERLTPEPTAEEPTPVVEETTPPTTEVAEAPAASEETTTPTDDRLTAEEPTTDGDQPKLNVGDTSEAVAEVGSRSLLIEEQLTGTGGAVPFSGSTEWSRDVDELGAPVIKARVSIPARNLAVDVLFRKNGDAALPASHLVEVNFSVTESFLGGGIASLPGILLKDQELAQGNPLVGASARIFDNSFLFALSAAEADLAKNLDLIAARGWIDLPVVYSTGRKAIVTLEKGKEGGAIFEAVLAAWATE